MEVIEDFELKDGFAFSHLYDINERRLYFDKSLKSNGRTSDRV